MRFVRLVLLALLLFPVPVGVAAQEADIGVRGDARRMEIERILAADNLDTSRLDPREVAEAMAAIERGRAPEDFWVAYRAHVVAWQRLADAVDRARRRQGGARSEESEQMVRADQAIDSTFDEVERIARRYGARLPTPPWKVLPTV